MRHVAAWILALLMSLTVGFADSGESTLAAKSAPAKLYHYTSADPATIASEGLVPGASKKVFTTPAGELSPLQAQIDLALPPNRGLPQHLIEIDVPTLQKIGVEIPDATLVGRKFNMPGGGMEVIFPQKLPAEALKVIR